MNLYKLLLHVLRFQLRVLHAVVLLHRPPFLLPSQEVMADFEALLWGHLENYEELAQENPTLLVDCLRVIELQVWFRGSKAWYSRPWGSRARSCELFIFFGGGGGRLT